MTAVSIVMPVHQMPLDLFHRAVSSVALQTHADLELIVVDDGSGPGWEHALQIPRCTRRDLRIRPVRLPSRGGIARARNVGAQLALGRWLMWLDGDDWLAPDCVERLLERDDGQALLVLGECNVIESGSVMRRGPAQVLKLANGRIGTIDDPLMRFIFAIQPQILRRRTFFALGGFDESYLYAELTELFLRFVSAHGLDALRLSPHATYNYSRDRAASVSKARSELEAHRMRCLTEYRARAGYETGVIRYLGWDDSLAAQAFELVE